jgi:hypothetical protein
MRKCAVYRAIAIVHAQQAASTRSDKNCETHVRLAASFLTLANSEAMRHLKAASHLSLNALTDRPAREVISVRCLGRAPTDGLLLDAALTAAASSDQRCQSASKQEESANHEKWKNNVTEKRHVD